MAEARAYVSPTRQQRARDTRRAIVAAAFELFVDNGYLATSVREIADRAGISDQRIYQTFGTKRELLRQVLEAAITGDGADEADVTIHEEWQAIAQERDPRRRAEVTAANAAAIAPRAAPLMRVLKEAVWSDSEFQPIYDAMLRQRLIEMERTVQLLAGPDPAAPPPNSAAATLFTLLNPETYAYLIDNLRWSSDQYRAWLADAIFHSLHLT